MNGDIFYRSADIMSNKNICKGTLRELVKKNISLAYVLYTVHCTVQYVQLLIMIFKKIFLRKLLSQVR